MLTNMKYNILTNMNYNSKKEIVIQGDGEEKLDFTYIKSFSEKF